MTKNEFVAWGVWRLIRSGQRPEEAAQDAVKKASIVADVLEKMGYAPWKEASNVSAEKAL